MSSAGPWQTMEETNYMFKSRLFSVTVLMNKWLTIYSQLITGLQNNHKKNVGLHNLLHSTDVNNLINLRCLMQELAVLS